MSEYTVSMSLEPITYTVNFQEARSATIQVGTITTGAAGSSVIVTNVGTVNAAIFDITIPRGNTGATGLTGPAGTITVGTVTTGAAGSSVVIENVGTANAAILNITIPSGDMGAAGSDASVTNANVNAAISSNSSASRSAMGMTTAGSGLVSGGALTTEQREELRTQLDVSPVNNDYRMVDHFPGKAHLVTGYFGQLNWYFAPTNGYQLWSDNDALPRRLGCPSLACNNAAGFFYVGTHTSSAALNGVSFELVFNPWAIGSSRFFIGARNWASTTAETGRRGLFIDVAAGDTFWSILHETSAGVRTRMNFTKSIVAGQFVRVKIAFVSATTTTISLQTESSQSIETLTLTSGFSMSGSHGIGVWTQVTTAVWSGIAPDLAIITVPPQPF